MSNSISKKIAAAALGLTALAGHMVPVTTVSATTMAAMSVVTTTTAKAESPRAHNYLQYELRMTCYSSKIQNTGSKNVLNVTFHTTRGKSYLGRKLFQPKVHCGRGFQIVYRSPQTEFPTIDEFSHVTVSVTGHDALWIDKVQVRQFEKGSPGTRGRVITPGNWDAGHGNGFCISTDRGDNRGPWKPYVAGGGCTPKMTFAYGRGPRAH